jgi:valyl-tRNA synthetase
MNAADLTLRVQDHTLIVPRSQRGGEIVEPMLSMQWFVTIQPLAEKALAAVRDGRIRIVPERFEKIYYHWLENIEDWCISRQLWWGHRIPAWYGSNGEIHVGDQPPSDGKEWTPELDVLDTWFSSGLWPFSTLGWPEKTPDLSRFYPTTMMETGYDILFFWVARMIMMGLWFTDEAPFQTVYLHGLVRDKFGRKISKTLGNAIDPTELIEQYGVDPLRFTVITGTTPGNDTNLDTARVERNWRFVNKIWQMANFVTQNLDGELELGAPDPDQLDLPSRWIMSCLHRLIDSIEHLFAAHQYGEAARQIEDFLWTEFADWYIEISKHPLYQGDEAAKTNTRRVLVCILEQSLRLLHPYMPFVTEEIWQHLPHQGEALIIASYPKADLRYIDDSAEGEIQRLIDLIRGVRNVRDEYGVEPARKVTAHIAANEHFALFEQYGYLFSRLCNVSSLEWVKTGDAAPENAASVVVGDITLYLPLADFIDIAAECDRLTKEQAKLAGQIAKSRGMLGNEQFVTRAQPDVVEKERERLEMLEATAAQIAERLNSLCAS